MKTNRLSKLLAALAAALLIGLSGAGPLTAQEPGDQIVDPAQTPAADDSEQTDPETTQDDDPATEEPADSDTASDPDDTGTADDANSADSDETTTTTEDADDTTGTDDEASGPSAGDQLIVVEDLNLREEAEVEADVIQVMPAGSVVTLAGDGEEVNDFLPVEFEEDAGWAYLPFLVEEELGDNLAVVTTELNLREGPSIDDEVLSVMPEGAEVRVAGIATDDAGDDWNRVYYDGTLAWAVATYVEYFDDTAADSVESADDTVPADAAASEETTAPAATGDLVTVTDANVRAGASLEDEVLSVVPLGTFATATGEAANGFVPVSVNGIAGWLSTDVIAPAEIAATLTDPAATDETATFAAAEEPSAEAAAPGTPDDDQPRTTLSDLNLRAGPSPDAEILLLIPAGDTLTLTFDGYENGYAAVSYQGTTGWALGDFLQE